MGISRTFSYHLFINIFLKEIDNIDIYRHCIFPIEMMRERYSLVKLKERRLPVINGNDEGEVFASQTEKTPSTGDQKLKILINQKT